MKTAIPSIFPLLLLPTFSIVTRLSGENLHPSTPDGRKQTIRHERTRRREEQEERAEQRRKDKKSGRSNFAQTETAEGAAAAENCWSLLTF
jgi:hypothetical protein